MLLVCLFFNSRGPQTQLHSLTDDDDDDDEGNLTALDHIVLVVEVGSWGFVFGVD